MKPDSFSRRDALRAMALSPLAASILSSVSASENPPVSSSAHIVIVGGGAGAMMVLARLRRALSSPNITVIAPNDKHIYQAGQVFVAAGEYSADEIVFDNTGYIGHDVNWIKDEVKTFLPDQNQLITLKDQEITYDYLIVATGVQYHYEWIEGLNESLIGQHGIASVYLNNLSTGSVHGATTTREWFDDILKSSSVTKPRILFTQPSTPMKCGGAPQKMLYLCDDYLKRHRKSADFVFTSASEKLFSIDEIDTALHKVQQQYGNITNYFEHDLIRIDPIQKRATFNHNDQEVTLEYDFIHITPPMSAVDSLVASPLGWQKGNAKGWLEVDMETLRHKRYPNVFGIGDTCGIPLGKTGGSARHHALVVAENLVSVMKNQKPTALFDGYTVCPIKTEYGKIMMVEFNYDGLSPTFSSLHPSEPMWMWWALDLYALKPMYRYLMLNGLM